MIAKLTEELNRVKNRNLLLEQTHEKVKPETPVKQIVEVPVVLNEASKAKLKLSSEGMLFLQSLATTIECMKLTLPLYNTNNRAPGSPSTSNFSRASVIDDGKITVGEALYPSFNSLTPLLVEAVPFLIKSKSSSQKETVLKTL